MLAFALLSPVVVAASSTGRDWTRRDVVWCASVAFAGGFAALFASVLTGGATLPLAVVLVFAAAAAATDARFEVIPNLVSAAATVVAVAAWVVAGFPIVAVGVAVASSLIFFGLYIAGWIGAGDVKILPALVLTTWLAGGSSDPLGSFALMQVFLLATSVAHLAWTSAVRVLRGKSAIRGGVPFAPAMFFGGIVTVITAGVVTVI